MQQQSDSTALLFWIKACNKPQEALIRKALLLFLCLFLGVCVGGGGDTVCVQHLLVTEGGTKERLMLYLCDRVILHSSSEKSFQTKSPVCTHCVPYSASTIQQLPRPPPPPTTSKLPSSSPS